MIERRVEKDTPRKRREFLRYSTAALLGTHLLPHEAFAQSPSHPSLSESLARIEQSSGGRIGVALLDCVTGQVHGLNLDARFPMCSTFKVLAVAATLSRIDAGTEQLQRSVPITESDILKYAPVTSQHVGSAGMTVAQLCAAAIQLSDNTAANLLLRPLGGPEAVTRFARSIGDRHTRLDRTEPTLNEATPGDPRDTTTPRAMAQDLNALLLGSRLEPASRALLKEWMVSCQTGLKKIRSAVPAGYTVGDKTGSGDHNTSNDIAVIWPPDRAPWILTTYLTDLKSDSADEQAALIATTARTCMSLITG